MKFAIPLSLLLCAVIGCNWISSRTTPSQPSARTVQESREVIFQRKMECQKYRKQFEDALEPNQYQLEAIYRVFYSPKQNSCLLARYILYPQKGKPTEETAEIYDILSQKQVWFIRYPESKKFWEVQADLDEQIEKLE